MRNRRTCMVPDRLQVEVVPQTEGVEDQIYRIYTADMQLCPTLQDDITNSEKTYRYIVKLTRCELGTSQLADQLVKLQLKI